MSTTIPEAETLTELIADCRRIPGTLAAELPLPQPPSPRRWTEDEIIRCRPQVDDLDGYV